MPRLLKIRELEARRKALAQESDVYRETLKLQIQNLQLYAAHTRQRFTSLGPTNPWLMLIGPLVGAFINRGRAPKMRLVTAIIFGWRLWQKLRVLLPTVFRRKRRRRSEEEDAPPSPIREEEQR